jgi:hypothetical protein
MLVSRFASRRAALSCTFADDLGARTGEGRAPTDEKRHNMNFFNRKTAKQRDVEHRILEQQDVTAAQEYLRGFLRGEPGDVHYLIRAIVLVQVQQFDA